MKRMIVGLLFMMLLVGCAPSEAQPASELTVEMRDFSYAPSSITVSAGQPVKITLKNVGNVEHDFVVDPIDVSAVEAEGSGVGSHHTGGEHADYDLHVSTNPNGTSILTFTPNEPGTYKIFCSVEGHEVAGMVGELIVVSQ